MNDVLSLKNKEIGVVGCYNTREKIYKNGLCKLQRNSFDIFVGKPTNNTHTGSCTSEECETYAKKHLKEKKEKILDLALNNDHWQYFVNLTFSDEELGGKYSHEKAIELLRKWINNQKHQNPTMSYLMVSEFHKSGRLHFHGIFANVSKWNLVPARYPKSNRLIKINGKQIFNLMNYKLGYTTVSEVESQERVSNYISKYINKELMNLKFKKAFWYSRDLEKPKLDYHYYDKQLSELYTENVEYSDQLNRNDSTIELLNFRKL